MSLELTSDDRELLVEVLKGRLTELREEVHHARLSSFKDRLRQKEERLAGMIGRINEDGD